MGREIHSDDVRHGVNASLTALNDHHYIRCKHCGFICNTDRDMRAQRGSRVGDGRKISTYEEGWFDDWMEKWFQGQTEYDPTVVLRGCPFCGCLLYDE